MSNDNPYSESLFRTAKYRPDYPAEGFTGIVTAREWVLSFVHWYNFKHRHSGIKFVTPDQRHRGADIEILENRDDLYKQAKMNKPERWSGQTRDWSRPAVVMLNPDKVDTEKSCNGEFLAQ